MLRSAQYTMAAFLSLAIATAAGSAQPIALPQMPSLDIHQFTPPQNYTGQSIIRIRTTTQDQLDRVLDLTTSVWSERTGVGLLDIQIHTNQIPMLKQMGVTHDVLIEDLQAHHDAQWAALKAAELDRAQPRGAWTHNDAWFSNYKQFADIISQFNAIAAARPDIAEMSDVGDSLNSNDIYALTITGPDSPENPRTARPVVIWNGAQHAREWVSPMTVSYLASKLVDEYDTDSRVSDLINNTRIVIVPVMNPDGYLYTWSNERYWRKNRRNNGGGSFGVDLNRNWGYEWGGQGASSFPGDETYHGPSAFSEPETQVMRDLAQSYGDDLVAHIDYHTYSQLILWPFGYADGVQTPEPDRTFFDNLATAMSDEILDVSGVFYDPIQSVDLYPAAGDSSDWFYGELGVKSLTIELRPDANDFDGFDPDPSQILPTARENYAAALLFLERTTLDVSFGFDAPQIVEAQTPTPVSLLLTDIAAQHDPSSIVLLARTGTSGEYTPTPMVDSGDNTYTADLPPAPCGEVIEYYFTASTTGGDALSYPSEGASSPLSVLAQEFNISFEDDMETDTGWTVGSSSDTASTGIWERAVPQSTGAQPGSDHTDGAGTMCWVTGASAGSSIGANDIDGGATTLTSPILDAIALGDDAEIAYWRWYSNDQGASPNEDEMLVEISNDLGNSWTTLEVVSENTGQWIESRFRVADYVEPTDMIRVRFIASDFGDGSIVEAAIDDVRVEAVGCDKNRADLNGDGELNFFDVSIFLNAFNAQDPIADFTDDGQFNFFDVSNFLALFSEGI